MNVIHLIEKFVVRDKNTGLCVQCWTENETIFFTDNIDDMRTYQDAASAKSMVGRINEYANCFLNAKGDKEIKTVNLEAVLLQISYAFKAL